MFTRIIYEVTFPTGPRPRFKGDHHFQPGFGAIVGPNEAGKSMILEFLRFSLFGSAALRGPTTDYKTLKVRTEFILKDVPTVIERTITNAKLIQNGETIVVGTTPVNAKLVELLGFGLKVFDVSNNISQGDIDTLGKMRPAERQKLVDGTVGLDKIDVLLKECNDQALGFDREANTIERNLVEPTEPIEPECWPNRGAIQDFLTLAEKEAVELAGVEGELRAPRMTKPVEPTCDVTESEEDLTTSVLAESALIDLRAELKHLPPHIDVAAALATIEAYAAYAAAKRFLQENPAPAYSREQLEQWLKDLAVIEQWAIYKPWRRRINELEHLLKHAEEVTCPSCSHAFPLDPEAIARAEAEHDQLMLTTVPMPSQPEPHKPLLTLKGIEHQLAIYDDLVAKRAEAEAVPEAPTPDIWCRREELPRFETANTRRPELEQEISEGEKLLVDEAAFKLGKLRRFQLEQENFASRLADYEAQQERIAKLEKRREEVSYAPARVTELRPIVAAFAPYERDLARYQQDLERFKAGQVEAIELFAKGAAWRKAKEALGQLRSLIKLHLYPSLAKAASYFLAGMTGGERSKIEISDGFDILVDGQGLETLSGSGKAVANLAVRLGLGRVLTHSVFPVVLADEIDASMDDNRAEKTADILQQCAKRLSQLLLVSHKTPEADYYVEQIVV